MLQIIHRWRNAACETSSESTTVRQATHEDTKAESSKIQEDVSSLRQVGLRRDVISACTAQGGWKE